jgi:hypothetical protein
MQRQIGFERIDGALADAQAKTLHIVSAHMVTLEDRRFYAVPRTSPRTISTSP